MSTILSSDEIDRFIAHLIAEDAAERDITTESVVDAVSYTHLTLPTSDLV